MNDLKEAIDRIGERFDASAGGLPTLEERRRRSGAQRRLAAASVALVVGIAGSVLVARAFLGPTDGSPEITIPQAANSTTSSSTSSPLAGTAICPTPSGDSPPSIVLESTTGAAGSTVRVSGSFQTGQAWLQLWWNADDTTQGRVSPPPWPATGPDLREALDPKTPGLMTELASVAGPASTGSCSFTTAFTVPDVPPRSYQVMWAFGAPASSTNDEHSFALFTSHLRFEVAG